MIAARARLVSVLLLCIGSLSTAQLPEEYEPSRGFPVQPEDGAFYEAVAELDDIWELRRFEFKVGDKLKFRLNACTVVFGHSDGVVLWAAVFPERPMKLSTAYGGGDGEGITSIWMRFHPSRLGGIFEPRFFKGRRGDPSYLYRALRVAKAKQAGTWEDDGRLTMPPVDEVLVDIDTEEGRRRYFKVDVARERVEYEAAYVSKALPQLPELERGVAKEVIAGAVTVIERDFVPVQLTDGWEDRKADALKRSSRLRDAEETAAMLFNLVSPLGPGIRFRYQDEVTSTYTHRELLNADYRGTEHTIGDMLNAGPGARRTVTDHGVGYILLSALDDRTHVAGFDSCLDSVEESWALILDLRYLEDGDEAMARQVAGRFLVEGNHVYGQELGRGDAPLATGAPHDAFFEARGPWPYESPVYVLTGRRLSEGGEMLAVMLASLPHVKTLGAPTSGAGMAGPWQKLAGGFEISVAPMLRLDNDGRAIRGFGYTPDVASPGEDKDFGKESDPVAYEALDNFYRNAPDERLPGRRELAETTDDSAE